MFKKVLKTKIEIILKKIPKPYTWKKWIQIWEEYVDSIRVFISAGESDYRKRTMFLFAFMLGIGILALPRTSPHTVEAHAKERPAFAVEESKALPPARFPIPKAPHVSTQDTADTASEPAEEEAFVPSPTYLNLVRSFAPDKDASDPTQSYGAAVFHEISSQEGSWYSEIIAQLDDTPSVMAKRLGIGQERILGKYDITDKEHNPLQADTWTIKKWGDVQFRIHDANGADLESNSNVKEILAMANVYGYYHGWKDHELFLQYAQALWNRSHSHHFSMSDVYYEGDVLTDERIEAAKSAGQGKEIIEYFEKLKQEKLKETADSLAESSMETEKADASTEAEETASAQGTEEAEPILAEEEINSEASPSNSTIAQEIATNSNAIADAASRFETDADGNVIFAKNTGKLRLTLDMTITGLSGRRNLFALDTYGNAKENYNEQWQGWTEDKIAQVQELCNQDWYAEYGLSVSAFSTGQPLSKEEINGYMNALPANLSEERRKVVEFALNSVGYVPYYFGGKPSSAHYSGNNFYTIIAPDYKGRVFRGLDCSGWVNWVIWSAIDKKLPASSTSSFIHTGKAIDRSSLQPGDIIVRAGGEDGIGHIVIFLAWSGDGNMICIHETGQPVNNVTISTMNADWNYRNILD